MNTSRCRSCGAPILWGITAKGHRMPIDPEPTAEGNVIYDGQHISVLKRGERDEHPEGTLFHHSHFQTCPNRAEHRRKR